MIIQARAAEHSIIHRDPFAYSAHPQIVIAANGDWLVVFNKAPRRDIVLHPPEDPLFRNFVTRSRDRGATWSVPQVVPNYEYCGTECAALTTLNDGSVMLHQWQFYWHPLSLARTLPDQRHLVYPERFMKGWLNSPEHEASGFGGLSAEDVAPWVRGPGKTFAHFSSDNGESFSRSVEINTEPFSGGYGMRRAVQLQSGRIILPLCDVPNYRTVFIVTSDDGGLRWSPASLVAQRAGSEFEEPTIVRLESGKLLMVLRDNGTRRLRSIESADDGITWSAPQMLPIEGYPADLLDLGDKGLLLTYGWRFPDFGVHAVRSYDEGATWDIDNVICVRNGLPNKNLGYPATIQTADGSLYTAYYGEDSTGVTCIMATRWSP